MEHTHNIYNDLTNCFFLGVWDDSNIHLITLFILGCEEHLCLRNSLLFAVHFIKKEIWGKKRLTKVGEEHHMEIVSLNSWLLKMI